MSTFVNYIKSECHIPLENRLLRLESNLKIDFGDSIAIESFLAPLKNKGPVYRFHYDHSLRVAFLCVAVAEFMHLDKKAMYYSGLLHDIGKALVPVQTLGKTTGWTDKDTKIMRPHVMDGYKLIRGRFDFSAEVILWHHKFQTSGYPSCKPSDLHHYSLGTKMMIQLYGRILALCDQFDAFHRVNDKQGVVTIPTGESIKALMLKTNPDQVILLEELYRADIFTTYIEDLSAHK